ncbi:hypothetical protein [Legionella sp. WA2022007384]
MKPIIKDLSVIILIGLLLLWGFLAAIERLVFFNTNLYPDFLVSKTISLESKEKMFELIKLTCPQGGADSIERDDVLYFRCGLLWPKSQVTKVYLVNKSNSDESNKN